MTQCMEAPAEAVVGRRRGWRISRWQVSEPEQVRPVASAPTVGELLVRLDPFLAAR
ncbi:hypothetical protein GZH49_10040 [Nocardia terpenica]|uniref:hypothetical protein n=1 Tax=Nocardia terpenica TaxID=455432 RepID=UPI002FE08674